MQRLESIRRALKQALADPVGRPPLKLCAEDKENALVVVADHTRNNAYSTWLPALLDELNDVGLSDSQITLYVGSGTHRPPTKEEMLERYGKQVESRVAVAVHDCDAQDDMLKVGRTDYGTTIYVPRRVFKTDLLIITGGIQYHYFAGYSGGRKAILPGCCARETILCNHRRALNPDTAEFATNVATGVMVNNPVSEDMHEACTLLRPDMCVNVVLNAKKEVAWIGAGDYGYVHRIGAQFLDEHNLLAIEEPAQLAIISSGGYPKDLSLFQAHKALRHTLAALQPGAKVIWIARCDEGEGPDEMPQWRDLDLSACKARVQTNISLVSLCALSLKQIADLHDIHLVSELPPQVVKAWGFTPYTTLSDACNTVLADSNNDAVCLLGLDMSNLLPMRLPMPDEESEELSGD